jgi:hypothetical protein
VADSLYDLSKQLPTADEFAALMKDIDSMDGRAAALILAAMIDNFLELAIITKFTNRDRRRLNAIFRSSTAPLTSLSAKISVAHALGLCGNELRIQLDRIRSIRNAFAHAMLSISFDDPLMWCLRAALLSVEGKRLVEVLERLFPGLFRDVAQTFSGLRPWILENTYLTCLSEHCPDEDVLGRLSMWRAYGGGTGVAVVATATPFLTVSDALRAYASPVGYFTEAEFHQRFVDVVNRIEANEPFLRGIDREEVKNRLFNMFLFAATCTKHPGFKEELEWRVIHHPDLYPSPHLTKSIETIRGVPQPVYKIRLRNIPAEIATERLDGIEIPELVERVIIGPTQHPRVMREALIMALSLAGVHDAERRVVISDIPLRQ